MRCLYVVLTYHSIVHGGVYFRMTEKFLHLLNGHPFANGICGESASKLVGMHAVHVKALSDFTKSQLYGAYGQTIMGL